MDTSEGEKAKEDLGLYDFVEISALTQMNLKKVFDSAIVGVLKERYAMRRIALFIVILVGPRAALEVAKRREDSAACCNLFLLEVVKISQT